MTRIGQTSVNSTVQILTVVEIEDITIEVLFHVLPDYYLKHDIMIGREILAQGIAVNMTSDKLNVTTAIDFDMIDSDVLIENRTKLLEILKTFETSFTSGVPSTPAYAEPMQTRLKDPPKTDNRRPYRLSPNEGHIVRNKVNELLKANIIR